MFRDLVDDFDDEGLDGYSIEPNMMLDVPFVPTDECVVEAMLNLGEVGPDDVLYDLGCGDGRILITAARDRNTRGIGVEIDPLRISEAMEEAAYNRVEYLLEFIEESLFTVDISEATVVTLYLLDSVNVELRPRLLSELRPGTRILSHAFSMGDWEADERLDLVGVTIYKWIVPAQIAGDWEWDGLDDKRYSVSLQQKYQKITGTAWIEGEVVDLISAALCGDCLELKMGGGKNTAPTTFTLYFENNELQSVLEGD